MFHFSLLLFLSPSLCGLLYLARYEISRYFLVCFVFAFSLETTGYVCAIFLVHFVAKLEPFEDFSLVLYCCCIFECE